MSQFSTAREAKEFLAERIAEEARRRGTPLSEIERKMLYFSESGWTLPEIGDVAQEFAQRYDTERYERKIKSLCRAVKKRMTKEDARAWSDAIHRIAGEDHYLLVLIGAPVRNPAALTWQQTLGVLGLIAALFVYPLALAKYLGRQPAKDEEFFYAWLVLAPATGIYWVIYEIRHRR